MAPQQAGLQAMGARPLVDDVRAQSDLLQVEARQVIAEAIALPFVFFLQPAVWILIIIGVGQALLLRKPGRNFTPGGLVRVSLILVAYLFGTFFLY